MNTELNEREIHVISHALQSRARTVQHTPSSVSDVQTLHNEAEEMHKLIAKLNPVDLNKTSSPLVKQCTNIVAFVVEFSSNTQYSAWYEAHNEKLEGWSGVVDYLAAVGEVFDRAVHSYIKDCSEDEANNFDWIIACERFTEQLLLQPPLPLGVVEDMADAAMHEAW